MPSPHVPTRRLPPGFEGLLEHHLDGLYRFALSLTRNPAEAEDVLQDCALKALEGFDRLAPGGNFKAWIFTILMNTFRDRYRRAMRSREVPLEAIDEPRSVGAEVFDRLLREEILAAVEALPLDFRVAVHLVDLEGLSYREAAQVLECPTGTVMSRLHRGRALLKVSLADLAEARGLPVPPSARSGSQP